MTEPLQGGCDFALAFLMRHASSFVYRRMMKAPFFSSRSLLAGGHRPLTHWAARRGSPSCRSCYRSVFRPACGPAGCRAHHTEGRDPARWWERQELNLRPPVWWCLEWPRSRPVLRHKRTPLCYIPIKAALYDRPSCHTKKLQELHAMLAGGTRRGLRADLIGRMIPLSEIWPGGWALNP